MIILTCRYHCALQVDGDPVLTVIAKAGVLPDTIDTKTVYSSDYIYCKATQALQTVPSS